MCSVCSQKTGRSGATYILSVCRLTAVLILALVTALAALPAVPVMAEETGSIEQPVLATDSASFVSQSAALSTSTIRGLLGDVSADVRGPSSSYTLTIDSTGGDDIKSLLSGTRYSLIECYDLSLTAVDTQSITRNPQFGDVTITIPIASSMEPSRGTFAICTIGTDGSLEYLPCSVIYSRSGGYAVRFMTIHFSTYAIVYTSGGSTRVTGTRPRSSSSSGITSISSEGRSVSNTDDRRSTGNTSDSTAASSLSGTGNSGSAASATGTSGSAASGNSSGITATANGKDNNGKGLDGKDPYDNPKTGDRRYYGTLSLSILVLGVLFLIIARLGRRRAR